MWEGSSNGPSLGTGAITSVFCTEEAPRGSCRRGCASCRHVSKENAEQMTRCPSEGQKEQQHGECLGAAA